MRLHLGMLQALQAGDIEEADRCEQKLQVGGQGGGAGLRCHVLLLLPYILGGVLQVAGIRQHSTPACAAAQLTMHAC